jgi:uncharacterized membrane protein
MSAPDSGSPSGGRNRWLVPLLVASVAINLVIVGAAVSGQVWPDHDGRKGSHRSADLMPRSFFRALDDERREELVGVFRARKTEWREERRALRDAATALADALEREPFDVQLTHSAIADHAARSHLLVDLGAAVAADLVEALSPAERRDLAQATRQRVEEDHQRRARRER